jgi:hypothetical protein
MIPILTLGMQNVMVSELSTDRIDMRAEQQHGNEFPAVNELSPRKPWQSPTIEVLRVDEAEIAIPAPANDGLVGFS